MKKLLTLLSLLLFIAPAMAEEPTFHVDGNYEYYLMTGSAGSSGGAVLTGYLPAPGSVGAETLTVLPAEIAGHPIVGYNFVFGEFAPDGKIIVQNGVTDFGLAFNWSYFSGEIVLPASLTHIEEGSLFGVRAEITVHPDNPHFTCADGFLIDTRTSTLLYVAPSAADKPLPAVRRLGDHCLDNWHAGETVVLPKTLSSIGAGIFSDCVDVKHITIPAGVTEIGAGAFNCTGLTEVTLPAGLTAIEGLTFSCTYLTEVVIPEGVERIESWAFYLCPLTRVEIPVSCTFVAADAFDPEVELVLLGGNTHVETEEELEARERGVEHLEGNYGYALTEEGAVITDYFWDEVVPAEIIVPDTLGGQPVVGVDAWAFCTMATGPWERNVAFIRLPEGLRFIDCEAFRCAHNIDALYLPASLEVIPEGAFDHYDGEVIPAENSPFISHNGFLIDVRTNTLLYAAPSSIGQELPAVRRYGTNSLVGWGMDFDLPLIIPEGVEVIGNHAIYDFCYASITLPSTLRILETGAFESIFVVEPIIVPAGVELIEFGAFGLYSPVDTEVVILGENTRVETAMEYALRTGETWVLQDEWEPTVYTPGWQ